MKQLIKLRGRRNQINNFITTLSCFFYFLFYLRDSRTQLNDLAGFDEQFQECAAKDSTEKHFSKDQNITRERFLKTKVSNKYFYFFFTGLSVWFPRVPEQVSLTQWVKQVSRWEQTNSQGFYIKGRLKNRFPDSKWF